MRRRRRIAVAILLILAFVLAAGYAAGSAIVYDRLSAVPAHCDGRFTDNTPAHWTLGGYDWVPEAQRDRDLSAWFMPDYLPAEFPSRDDRFTIRAWFVPGPHGTDGPAVVVVHGLASCRRDPVVLMPAGMLNRHGYAVLLMDMRDMGDSDIEDGRFAGGTEEYLDVLGGRDRLVAQGYRPERIGLYGASLGAATVLIATGQDQGVPAVFADSSYADVDTAIRGELERNGYPTWLAPGGVLIARLLSGDDLQSLSPLKAVPGIGARPAYLAHGAADERIRYENTLDLATAFAADGHPIVPWIVPGMGHTRAALLVPEEYEPRLVGFFDAAIGPGRP